MAKIKEEDLIKEFGWKDKCNDKSLLTEKNKDAISKVIINRFIKI